MFEKYVIVHNHYYKYIFWLCMNKAIFLLCVRHIPKHNPKQAWTDPHINYSKLWTKITKRKSHPNIDNNLDFICLWNQISIL